MITRPLLPPRRGYVEVEINGARTYRNIKTRRLMEEEQSEITALKQQLADTDYKIIKCSEYQLAGQELPYDVAALHAERQAVRDQINALEDT